MLELKSQGMGRVDVCQPPLCSDTPGVISFWREQVYFGSQLWRLRSRLKGYLTSSLWQRQWPWLGHGPEKPHMLGVSKTNISKGNLGPTSKRSPLTVTLGSQAFNTGHLGSAHLVHRKMRTKVVQIVAQSVAQLFKVTSDTSGTIKLPNSEVQR